mmetsp:Transcript_12984/g.35926  ORF Transcript_12984/g.35926 Transcript_12984/m.35926 type:complete len:212 (+) Transcript_12984:976-1611(+)
MKDLIHNQRRTKQTVDVGGLSSQKLCTNSRTFRLDSISISMSFQTSLTAEWATGRTQVHISGSLVTLPLTTSPMSPSVLRRTGAEECTSVCKARFFLSAHQAFNNGSPLDWTRPKNHSVAPAGSSQKLGVQSVKSWDTATEGPAPASPPSSAGLVGGECRRRCQSRWIREAASLRASESGVLAAAGEGSPAAACGSQCPNCRLACGVDRPL